MSSNINMVRLMEDALSAKLEDAVFTSLVDKYLKEIRPQVEAMVKEEMAKVSWEFQGRADLLHSITTDLRIYIDSKEKLKSNGE